MIVCKRDDGRLVLLTTRPGEPITLDGAKMALVRVAVREATTTTAAATLLGISQQALRRYAAKYGISLPRAGGAP